MGNIQESADLRESEKYKILDLWTRDFRNKRSNRNLRISKVQAQELDQNEEESKFLGGIS